ncbi:MAG: type II toxin-antitoxin system RelB/DinJ family antitoxin [Selenomonadaceae bacterium]
MPQTSVNIRMDSELKNQFENFCNDVGMNMTTAFNIFAKTAVREQKIPFEISAKKSDPFYSSENIARLKKSMAQVEAGKAHFTEHELIEV